MMRKFLKIFFLIAFFSMAALLAAQHALAAGVIYSNDFETKNISDAGSGWTYGDRDSISGSTYWKEVNSTSTPGGVKSLWCAGFNPYWDLGDQRWEYQNNMNAYAKLTVDLAGYSKAALKFKYKIPSKEPVSTNDFGMVKVDNSSSSYQCFILKAQSSWEQFLFANPDTAAFDLTPYCGGPVTIEWDWFTDGIGTYEGMFIDDVLVENPVGATGATPPVLLIKPLPALTKYSTIHLTGTSSAGAAVLYSLNGGSYVNISLVANGAFSPTTALKLREGSNKIVVRAEKDGMVTTRTLSVKLDSTDPSISLTNPKPVYYKLLVPFSINSSDSVGLRRIEIFLDGNRILTHSPTALTAYAKTTWLSMKRDGIHRAYARAIDLAGNYINTSIRTFFSDNTKPSISSFTLPLKVRTGRSVYAYFRLKDSFTTGARVISRTYFGKRLVSSFDTKTFTEKSTVAGYRNSIPWRAKNSLGKNLPAGRYKVCLYARDMAGNTQAKVVSRIVTVTR